MNKFIEVDIANTDSKTLVRSERFMSNKTEILSFDDWINVNGFNFRPEQYDLYKSLYEEGQQSKQDEIDKLQKQIDDCIKAMDESICDIDCGTIYGILTGDQL